MEVFQMVITLARAIAWGVSGLLGVRHDEPVAHRDLQHAHWDPVTRTWFTHEESVVLVQRSQRDRLPVAAAVTAAEEDLRGVGDRLAS
jgi:hypothetical protein